MGCISVPQRTQLLFILHCSDYSLIYTNVYLITNQTSKYLLSIGLSCPTVYNQSITVCLCIKFFSSRYIQYGREARKNSLAQSQTLSCPTTFYPAPVKSSPVLLGQDLGNQLLAEKGTGFQQADVFFLKACLKLHTQVNSVPLFILFGILIKFLYFLKKLMSP